MNKQVFANHDFNVVKNGFSSTYSKPPYQEEYRNSTPVRDIYALADDVFSFNVSKKIKGKNNTPSTSNKIEVLQKYISDKKGFEVQITEPSGKDSLAASFKAGALVNDVDLLEYFYYCCLIHYKDKFKI